MIEYRLNPNINYEFKTYMGIYGKYLLLVDEITWSQPEVFNAEKVLFNNKVYDVEAKDDGGIRLWRVEAL